jgi:hypothetical protein
MTIPAAPPLPAPVAAPLPAPVPRGKSVTHEGAPAADIVKIGIEVEGVGTVATKWTNPPVVDPRDFHDVFKRMPLVRSKSYGDLRGVYINPEDGDTFGTSGPAELVSRPHALTPESLALLRNSVWKAIRSSAAPTTGRAIYSDPRTPTGASGVAASRWARHRGMARIAGSLQTTVGVAVGKLLGTSPDARAAVVTLLGGDATKKARLTDMLTAVVAAETYLTATRGPMDGFAGRGGLRLALFFAFWAPIRASIVAVSRRGWGKDALGCNFKGMSSFLGCGIPTADLAWRAAIKQSKGAATLRAKIITAITDAGGAGWVTRALTDDWDLASVGQPGLSEQTSGEGWYALPNFTKDGRLFTIVECREKAAPLNVKMAAFLNWVTPGSSAPPTYVDPKSSDWRKIVTQGTGFCGAVNPIIG